MNGQVAPRLLWAIKNIPQLSKAIEEEDALFGCVDTWLVYMLTNKGHYITDISNISGTAIYDPYDQNYALKIMRLFGMPNNLKLPEIKPSRYDFGRTDKTYFGAMIPIASLVSDQGASIYGCGCSSKGTVRLTLGTGTFLSYNTLNLPHASISGLYPTVAYQESEKKVFVAEGSSTDTGPILDWCKCLGLFDDYKEITTIIQSVEDSDGVFFIPAFSGLQAPFHDDTAACGFIGLKPTTTKAHMLRAVVESFAFRVFQLWSIMLKETDSTTNVFRVDGGVSQCDFLLQLISDLCVVELECTSNPEMTALGAAQLAALQTGFWTAEVCESQRKINRIIKPRLEEKEKYIKQFRLWKTSVERLSSWY
ncbi:hypothetical protein QYM36_001682 [Artemia franciscana]|nr:hypothetical protein QYM36_001682 [Artemia franciscana]KAK2725314.1 hypothetical protein QYM36_001682 [Artemia franciscana]